MLVWVFLFLILILVEAFIGDFTSLAISIGALAGIAAALLHLPFSFQIISFSIVAFVSIIMLRPYLQRKIIPSVQHFTADSFIGNRAEVIEKIHHNKKGRIKVGGETWFAESTVDIEVGETVIISEIDSAIMMVVPEQDVLRNLPHNENNVVESDLEKNELNIHKTNKGKNAKELQ